MNNMARNLRYLAIACMAAVIGISAVTAFGQHAEAKDKSKAAHKGEFCSNNNWNDGNRVSFSEVREMTVASNGTLSVDAGKNGGISVKGEDRSDVLIRACVQAWGTSEEAARAAANSVKINTGGEISADGPSGDNNWSVSYQIRAPRQTNTKLSAHNGGISITSVDGNAEFTTLNGGVNATDLSGSVKGRTTNGGVNVVLAGNSWKGSGLDVQTTNGGVNLVMASTYAANIETGTVNGGFKSDIPSVNITTEQFKGDDTYRSRSRRVAMSINGGGAPIKVTTTNGGVRITTPE